MNHAETRLFMSMDDAEIKGVLVCLALQLADLRDQLKHLIVATQHVLPSDKLVGVSNMDVATELLGALDVMGKVRELIANACAELDKGS